MTSDLSFIHTYKGLVICFHITVATLRAYATADDPNGPRFLLYQLLDGSKPRVDGSLWIKIFFILTLGNVTAPAATGKCTSLALTMGVEKPELTRLGIATQF